MTEIIRLTRFSCAHTDADRKRGIKEADRWTVYGVDSDGIEHVYVQHESNEEHRAWRQVDPLWRQAQGAIFRQLLDIPGMRDSLIRLNAKHALESGREDEAVELLRMLMPGGWAELNR